MRINAHSIYRLAEEADELAGAQAGRRATCFRWGRNGQGGVCRCKQAVTLAAFCVLVARVARDPSHG
jgi:hypothetical protein